MFTASMIADPWHLHSNSLRKSLMYYRSLTIRISSDISKSCSTLSVFITWKETLDYFFKQIFISSILFFSSSFTCLIQKHSIALRGISSNSRKVLAVLYCTSGQCLKSVLSTSTVLPTPNFNNTTKSSRYEFTTTEIISKINNIVVQATYMCPHSL